MILNLIFESKIPGAIVDLTPTLGFIYGPILYWYIVSLTRHSYQLRWNSILDLIPWVVSVVLLFLSKNTDWFGIAIFSSMVFYISRSVQKISHYQKVILDTQSRFESIALSWIKKLLFFLICILLLEVLRNFFLAGYPLLENVAYFILTLSLLIFVLTLTYKGLKQSEVYNGITVEDEEITKDKVMKYKNSALTSEQLDEYASKLQDIMDDQRPYRNPSLNIGELSKMLKINPRHLSQTINSEFGVNFSEYVNSHRVEEAKTQLKNSSQTGKTVLEILFDVGFNTKSNFNTSFKQITGKTPSEYKADIEKEKVLFRDSGR